MDIITQMLLPSPAERPSAADVVTKISADDDWAVLPHDTVGDIGKELALKKSQKMMHTRTQTNPDATISCSERI
jgi:hypothetical protein